MATYKVHKTQNYTVMSNIHLRDKNLTLKAKGLLSVMLSLPDDWDYSINGIVAICKESNTAVESTLKELKKYGYLIVSKKLPNETESGRIEYLYDIYESPQAAEKQAAEKQGVENQGLVFQGLEIQELENKGQLNTKELNTKELNTKELNKENIIAVIDYLNEKTNTSFKANSKTTQQHINARLAEGFTLEDFKTVIDKKCAEWIGTEWEQYLRPSTLFGTKFEGYLNAPLRQLKTYGKTGIAINPNAVDDLKDIF